MAFPCFVLLFFLFSLLLIFCVSSTLFSFSLWFCLSLPLPSLSSPCLPSSSLLSFSFLSSLNHLHPWFWMSNHTPSSQWPSAYNNQTYSYLLLCLSYPQSKLPREEIISHLSLYTHFWHVVISHFIFIDRNDASKSYLEFLRNKSFW